MLLCPAGTPVFLTGHVTCNAADDDESIKLVYSTNSHECANGEQLAHNRIRMKGGSRVAEPAESSIWKVVWQRKCEDYSGLSFFFFWYSAVVAGQ